MGDPVVVCRPSGVTSILQRVIEGVASTELGISPIYVRGIGRHPRSYDNRWYFELEDPEAPTVRLRAWMEGKTPPQWNHLIVVSALVRVKVRKPGIAVEPELEILGVQETMVATTSRDELRTRFAAAFQRTKHAIADIFLKDKPHLVLVTNQGGEADRDIRSQLAGYEDLLTIDVLPVKMTNPQSVAQAVRGVQVKAGTVDCVVLARGGGEGIQIFDHEMVLTAMSERVIPLMTAIGHASDSTLADELADLTFPVPLALGRWLRDQLETKARRASEHTRLGLMDLDKEYRMVLGKLAMFEKERVERTIKEAQMDQERLNDRAARAELEGFLRVSREAHAHILSDQRLWKGIALLAMGVIASWVIGRLLRWW